MTDSDRAVITAAIAERTAADGNVWIAGRPINGAALTAALTAPLPLHLAQRAAFEAALAHAECHHA